MLVDTIHALIVLTTVNSTLQREELAKGPSVSHMEWIVVSVQIDLGSVPTVIPDLYHLATRLSLVVIHRPKCTASFDCLPNPSLICS